MQKKTLTHWPGFDIYGLIYRLCRGSSETVSFLRPFLRRAANTRRPFLVAIRLLKPCLFLRFLCEGWNVLFIFPNIFRPKRECKYTSFFSFSKAPQKKNQIIRVFLKVTVFLHGKEPWTNLRNPLLLPKRNLPVSCVSYFPIFDLMPSLISSVGFF